MARHESNVYAKLASRKVCFHAHNTTMDTRSFTRQRQAKRARIGPPIFDHATDSDCDAYLNMVVQHELAMLARKHDLELTKQRVMAELDIVMTLKEAYEKVGLYETRERVGLADIITEIQRRAFPRTDG